MAILLFAELVTGEACDPVATPDEEILEFLGRWSPEELDWLEGMLREEEGDDAAPRSREASEHE